MRTTWLIAAALLCGCRQESEKRPPPTAAPGPSAGVGAAPKTPADDRPVIACYGDSLTMGAGLDPGQSYPDVLQRDLDQRGYRYRVVNFGVNGDTTQDGLERLPLVLAEKPAIVVLEFGANDGLRGQPVANAEANLTRMVEALQQSGARVVVAGMTLPPNYGAGYIRRFEAMYKDLAGKYQLPLIPFLLDGVAGNAALMQRDGLHPTAAGSRIVAATVLKHLQPLLE